MSRVYNFSAGPAVLPEEVLKEAADEMLDYQGSGMSVMEMSHRSKVYDTIIKTAEQDLRDLMKIPDNYKVLFLQGGASQQFAMIPMNLMKNGVADYIVTGQWAKKAYQEACKYGNAKKIASSEDKTFPIFRIVLTFRLMKMQIMFTYVKIIRFMAQSIRNFQIRKARHLLRMFPPVSYQNRWMFRNMV